MAHAWLRRTARLAAAWAAVTASGVGPVAAAPDAAACEKLLAAGAYEPAAESPHAALERVRRFLAGVPAESLAGARATADALDVDPRVFTLRVGGVTAAGDWEGWRTRLRHTDFSRLEMTPRLAAVAGASSEALRTSLRRCLEIPGIHLYLARGDDPARFTIHLRRGAADADEAIGVQALTALPTSGGRALRCAPELPVGRRWLGIERPRAVPTPFESTCERTDLARRIRVSLVTETEERQRVLPAWQPPRAAPFERAVPGLRCSQGGGGDRVALRAVAACPSGEREALLHRWNEEAEVACAGARARVALRCASAPDGVTTVVLESEASGGGRVEGAAHSALVVDLNAHHCLVVDAATGPALALARPDRTSVALRAGLVTFLDPPGDWPLVAGIAGEPSPPGVSALRLRVLQAREEGGCADLGGPAPPRETTRSHEAK